jgi:hypothetical protein
MTAKQRKDLVQSIKKVLLNKNWSFDRWGNYKRIICDHEYRMKFQKTSLRFEIKIHGHWSNIVSDYFKNISIIDESNKTLIKFGNKEIEL